MATVFEEFRGLYTNWASTRWERYKAAVDFTQYFKNGFKEYIGAPDSYRDFDRDSMVEYVSLERLTPVDHEGRYKIDATSAEFLSFDKHITEDRDEGLVFGLGVWVDRWENSFPKEFLTFRLTFRPRSENTVLKVHLVPFDIDITDGTTWKPVYDHIISVIRKTLTTFEPPPEQESAPRSNPIGYFANNPGDR